MTRTHQVAAVAAIILRGIAPNACGMAPPVKVDGLSGPSSASSTSAPAPALGSKEGEHVLEVVLRSHPHEFEGAVEVWKSYVARLGAIEAQLQSELLQIDRTELDQLEAWKTARLAELQPVTDDKLEEFAAVVAEYNKRYRESKVAGGIEARHAEAAGRRLAALKELSDGWRSVVPASEPPSLTDRVIRAAIIRAAGRPGGIVGQTPALARTCEGFLAALGNLGVKDATWPDAFTGTCVDDVFALWSFTGPFREIVLMGEVDRETAAWALMTERAMENRRDGRSESQSLEDVRSDDSYGKLGRARRRAVAVDHRVIKEIGGAIATALEAEPAVAERARQAWFSSFVQAAIPDCAGPQWLEGEGASVCRRLASEGADKGLGANVETLLESYRKQLADCRESMAVKAMTLLEERAEFGFKGGKNGEKLIRELSDAAWSVQRRAIESISSALGAEAAKKLREIVDSEGERTPALFLPTLRGRVRPDFQPR